MSFFTCSNLSPYEPSRSSHTHSLYCSTSYNGSESSRGSGLLALTLSNQRTSRLSSYFRTTTHEQPKPAKADVPPGLAGPGIELR